MTPNPDSEQERVSEALGGLIDATEAFTTQADYTVEGGYETELVEAIDEAKRVLDLVLANPKEQNR